ncbi:MAG: GYD domain-containing protein [Chloroflexi bacterium]|nr:GYD domain-containing protein [Chloroflexota bacterium]
MATYVIMTRISPDALKDPRDFKQLAAEVSARIKAECPDVKWRSSFVTFGRFDVVDAVDSDSPDQVARAAMIIRSYGHAVTETMLATPWRKFLAQL